MRKEIPIPGIVRDGYHWVLNRYRGRPDSEHEQAIIRTVITSIVVVYLLFYGHYEHGHFTALDHGIEMLALYLLFSVGLLVWIGFQPGISILRRGTGIAADLNITAYVMPMWQVNSMDHLRRNTTVFNTTNSGIGDLHNPVLAEE